MYLEEPDSGSVSDIEWLSRRIHVRKKIILKIPVRCQRD